MKLSTNEREIINKISIISGLKIETIRNVFESLASVTIMDYIEGNVVYVPFLGNFTINHIKDIKKNNRKEAIININFKPNPYISRNIGQINDGDESDIEKSFYNKIQETIGEILE